MAEVMENNHNKRWDAGAGTTALSIIGTTLGGLATLMAGGNAVNRAANTGYGCPTPFENQCVSQNDLCTLKELDGAKAEIAKLEAEKYTDSVGLKIYEYFNGVISAMKEEQSRRWGAQEVINANTNSAMAVLKSQQDSSAALLASITRTAVRESSICNFDSHRNDCGCQTSVT